MKVREVLATLEAAGFQLKRRVGHGRLYVHPDGRYTTVPGQNGDELDTGTLGAIRRQTGLPFRKGE